MSTTSTISSGTTTISTPVAGDTSYIVEVSGTLDIVNGGIVSELVTISAGGTVNVSSGGEVLSTTISNGGLEFVSSGGTDSGAAVSGGGKVQVFSGGTTISDSIIGSGAHQ